MPCDSAVISYSSVVNMSSPMLKLGPLRNSGCLRFWCACQILRVDIKTEQRFQGFTELIHNSLSGRKVLFLMSKDLMLNSILLFPAYRSILNQNLINCFSIELLASCFPKCETIQSYGANRHSKNRSQRHWRHNVSHSVIRNISKKGGNWKL